MNATKQAPALRPTRAASNRGFDLDVVASLRSEHDVLEVLAERLIEVIEDDDRADVSAWMSELRDRVLEHMAAEERDLLPRYLREEPIDAAPLVLAHEAIRKALVDLDLAVDLHYLRADMVRAFLDTLREHARRENTGLYRWAREQGART
ncbi:MAG: hemerythrin domain-containing protein [Labilithrix sp.]|nr:hemerythrin domain-containing protein [Labilithrix sp.]